MVDQETLAKVAALFEEFDQRGRREHGLACDDLAELKTRVMEIVSAAVPADIWSAANPESVTASGQPMTDPVEIANVALMRLGIGGFESQNMVTWPAGNWDNWIITSAAEPIEARMYHMVCANHDGLIGETCWAPTQGSLSWRSEVMNGYAEMLHSLVDLSQTIDAKHADPADKIAIDPYAGLSRNFK